MLVLHDDETAQRFAWVMGKLFGDSVQTDQPATTSPSDVSNKCSFSDNFLCVHFYVFLWLFLSTHNRNIFGSILCYYTSTKSWRGYIFTAVCLCVCVCLSVCVSNFLVNKIPAKQMHRFGRGFR